MWQRLQNVKWGVLAQMKSSLWITIYFNLRFLILSIWQVFMGKQLSHSWWGHLKYAILAFRMIFCFSGVFFAFFHLSQCFGWREFENISLMFPAFLLLEIYHQPLEVTNWNPFPNQTTALLGQHQFVFVEFCGHSFEDGKSYLYAFFLKKKKQWPR